MHESDGKCTRFCEHFDVCAHPAQNIVGIRYMGIQIKQQFHFLQHLLCFYSAARKTVRMPKMKTVVRGSKAITRITPMSVENYDHRTKTIKKPSTTRLDAATDDLNLSEGM